MPPSGNSVVTCTIILCRASLTQECAVKMLEVIKLSLLSSCVITQTHTSTPKNIRKFLPLPTTVRRAPSLASNISIYTRMINWMFSFEGWALRASQSYLLTIWTFFFFYFSPCEHRKGNSLTLSEEKHTAMTSSFLFFQEYWKHYSISIQLQTFQRKTLTLEMLLKSYARKLILIVGPQSVGYQVIIWTLLYAAE